MDGFDGNGDAGGIGEREIPLRRHRLGRDDLEFARPAPRVELKGFLIGDRRPLGALRGLVVHGARLGAGSLRPGAPLITRHARSQAEPCPFRRSRSARVGRSLAPKIRAGGVVDRVQFHAHGLRHLVFLRQGDKILSRMRQRGRAVEDPHAMRSHHGITGNKGPIGIDGDALQLLGRVLSVARESRAGGTPVLVHPHGQRRAVRLGVIGLRQRLGHALTAAEQLLEETADPVIRPRATRAGANQCHRNQTRPQPPHLRCRLVHRSPPPHIGHSRMSGYRRYAVTAMH